MLLYRPTTKCPTKVAGRESNKVLALDEHGLWQVVQGTIHAGLLVSKIHSPKGMF